MNLKAAACCCDIAGTAIDCRQFLTTCFNTEDPLQFPAEAQVSGSASNTQNSWLCCAGEARPLVLYETKSGSMSFSGTLRRAYPPQPNDCNNGEDTWNNPLFGTSRVVYCGEVNWTCTGSGDSQAYCCDPSVIGCGPDQPQYGCDCMEPCYTWTETGSGTSKVILACSAVCQYSPPNSTCQCTLFGTGCVNLYGWRMTNQSSGHSGTVIRTGRYIGACCANFQAQGYPCDDPSTYEAVATFSPFGRGCDAGPCYGQPFCNRLDQFPIAYDWPTGTAGLGYHRIDYPTDCGPLVINENDGTFSLQFV